MYKTEKSRMLIIYTFSHFETKIYAKILQLYFLDFKLIFVLKK